MGSFLRGLFLVGCAVGGAYGAFRLTERALAGVPGGGGVNMEEGGVFLMIPVWLIGALVGVIVGGMFLPKRR